MASITGKPNLFFVTSPRTAIKMVDELKLLVDKYGGLKWDKDIQKAFANDLSEADFFEGTLKKDDDFGARDRITRAPKALGLVQLKPYIELTEAGKQFIDGKRPNEIFTRQLLKFQLPSPYHIDKNGDFFIKPYLELLRLIYELGGLTKTEIAIFFIECINISKYEEVKAKILDFRKRRKSIDRRKTSYKLFVAEEFRKQILHIYNIQIASGNFKTRESKQASLIKFVGTKHRNHIDYADAAIRYLRTTLLVTLEARTYKVVIPTDKLEDVEFLLKNTKREPLLYDDEKSYQDYLFDASIPTLYNDNIETLANDIIKFSKGEKDVDINELLLDGDIEKLKDIKDELVKENVEKVINEQVLNLQSYSEFDDILSVYSDVSGGNVIDRPLFFEWNTWRGFTMLDDGNIIGNFRVDDNGIPLHTAGGNQPDILCEYEEFDVLVEVTLSSGSKQYEMEGEPVARHVGTHKKNTGRETFCIFIAPTLSPATIAHFFILHKTDIAYYGGTSKIVPMTLNDFQRMLKVAKDAKVKPNSTTLKQFLENHSLNALSSSNEEEWYNQIKESIPNWLDIESASQQNFQ